MGAESWKYEQLQVAQLIDLNPGTRAGLFWTTPVSDDAVSVDLSSGTATLRLDNVGVHDYTDLAAALTSTATGHPSVATLSVIWRAARNPDGSFLVDNPPDDPDNLLHAAHYASSATIVFSGHHVADTERPGAQPAVPLAFRSGLSGAGDTTGQVTPQFGADPLGAGGQPWGVIGREQNGIYFPG